MSEKPDVNKIMAEIQAAAEEDMPPEVDSASVAAVDRDSNLEELLTHANAIFAQPVNHAGFKGVLHKLAVKILAPEFEQMRHFNELSIRIINKLAKMLTGNDTAETSDLSAQVRRRIDLLSDLGMRLDEIEKQKLREKIEGLEARLAELEAERK